jgi:hypothetical protein
MTKTSGGYECIFCLTNISKRAQMYGHLEQKHKIEKINPDQDETCHEKKLQDVPDNYPDDFYTKFIKDCADGYKCKLCTQKRSMRSKIYFHLKKIHKIDNGKEKEKCRIGSGSKHMGQKCELCGEMILAFFKKHKIECKLYSELIKKSSDDYECVLCSLKNRKRGEIYSHLRNTHHIGKDVMEIEDVKLDANVPRNFINEKIECIICGNFVFKENLLSHEKLHSSNQPTKTCEHCSETVKTHYYSLHVGSCRLYSSFMLKSSHGYDCQLCSYKSENKKARQLMYQHIKNVHRDSVKDKENMPENISKLKDFKSECKYCKEIVFSSKLNFHYKKMQLVWKIL